METPEDLKTERIPDIQMHRETHGHRDIDWQTNRETDREKGFPKIDIVLSSACLESQKFLSLVDFKFCILCEVLNQMRQNDLGPVSYNFFTAIFNYVP